ncbi:MULTISPECIES: cbb3-type cytochrome c oxidase subunit 3 [unclassified Rhodanobacter]|uniref:cbb3-type cytochrome oxidase subunit 3 n=1 Tax=unclassified Rhodanobacter TaxID=2621553 RepID=UPI00098444E2|nr:MULTISPECIES: cbb3-type cytochrome c oxidase subunit 3 [unclassified Rhodanobacter]OOG38530.1 cytochrome-c oxidase [Rhodanobacter sp. C05]OOG50132.1 cytochrome-c oxidase [Rhodanobacter sp. C01]OOG52318.1 cytochrome-c oxidase [Rhodanobacter sp. C03]OOG65949.1 cytochrome-c oxidase [Rhodanobacter sp. B04]
MSPVWGQIAGAFILAMMITFIGIWIWAWRKRHKKVFDQMAQLPMQEDTEEQPADTQAGTRESRP